MCKLVIYVVSLAAAVVIGSKIAYLEKSVDSGLSKICKASAIKTTIRAIKQETLPQMFSSTIIASNCTEGKDKYEIRMAT